MDFKTIKNTNHYLYDNINEFNLSWPTIPIRHNWRFGVEGEWVYTDDAFVCQILRKFTVLSSNNKEIACVRTVCGTFKTNNKQKNMLGEDGIAENIYTFSGKSIGRERFKDRDYTSKELMFARYVATGKLTHTEAYKLAYPEATSEPYIKRRCDKLLKTEKLDKMISEAKRKKLDEEGVTDNWLIERYKTIADLAESDTAKLRSLDSLAKISGLFENEQSKSEQVTIWRGFSPEQLEGVEKHGKPELVAHAEKDEND